ncbi:unnamed protein product, partial [marine sediment metagenome]
MENGVDRLLQPVMEVLSGVGFGLPFRLGDVIGVRVGALADSEGVDFEDMKNVCLEAERLGFDLFTVVDHFIAQWPLKDRDNNPLESWTTLAGLAAVTNRI